MTRSAVKMAQTILAVHDSSLAVDGRLGPETIAAYDKVSPDVRSQVQESVQKWERVDFDSLVEKQRSKQKLAHRVTPREGRGNRVATKQVAPRKVGYTPVTTEVATDGGFISTANAVALARKYNALASLPEGTMEFMLMFEAQRVSGGFDPSAIGGAGNRYRGLYQFHDNASNAWADGTRWARTFGVRVPPMYPNGWKDAEANTACAAGYATMNAKILRDAGLPVTKEILYAAHQQGAGAVKNMSKQKSFRYAGVQSGPSVRALQTAYAQLTA